MTEFNELIPFFNSISNPFPNPNFFLEQYLTPINILRSYFDLFPSSEAEFILDLGIGTGILTFLAFQKGAKAVIGIDIDKISLSLTKKIAISQNIRNLNLIHSSVEFFNFFKFRKKINGVIMNPPFGTKRKYLDFVFLKKGMSINGWILSLHKDNKESNEKLAFLCKENNYHVENRQKLIFMLPKTYKAHVQEMYEINVILYLLVPNL